MSVKKDKSPPNRAYNIIACLKRQKYAKKTDDTFTRRKTSELAEKGHIEYAYQCY